MAVLPTRGERFPYTEQRVSLRVYDVITGTDVFSIAGADLAPDPTKDDELRGRRDGGRERFPLRGIIAHRASCAFRIMRNINFSKCNAFAGGCGIINAFSF